MKEYIITVFIVILILLTLGAAFAVFTLVSHTISNKKIIGEIEQALKEKQYDRVEKLIQSGPAKKIDPFLVRYYLAQSYEGQGKLEMAIGFYEKSFLQISMSQSFYTVKIQQKIADLCFKLGRIDQALTYYEMVLMHEPQNHRALFNSADMLFSKKKFIKAKQLLETLMEVFPKDVKAKLLLARVMAKLNQYAVSEHYLHSIIEQQEVSGDISMEAREVLADIYYENKNFVQSAEIYDSLLVEQEVMGDPERALKVLKHLLMCLIIKRELKAAQYTFDNYADQFVPGEKLDLMYTMAEGLLKIGEFYRSITMVHAIHKRNPKFKDVQVTVDKFADLLEFPNLKFVFTREHKVAKQYIIQLLSLESGVETIYGDSYLIFLVNETNVIVNLSPFPLLTHEAQQCRKQLQMHDRTRQDIIYYSYSPMRKEMRDVFMLHEIKEIFGAAFIEEFK